MEKDDRQLLSKVTRDNGLRWKHYSLGQEDDRDRSMATTLTRKANMAGVCALSRRLMAIERARVLGRKIIEEAAKRGSKNHQIILGLMARGAEIRKTEDPSLLQEEYEHITGLTRSRSIPEKTIASARYRLRKNQLTKERDKFVAKTIDETLKEGETGVLFMGGYHNIFPYLPKDIIVKQVKDREKISAYFRELVSGGDGERFEQLAEYLASPCAN